MEAQWAEAELQLEDQTASKLTNQLRVINKIKDLINQATLNLWNRIS